jgi:hypothetical protein
VQRMRTTVLDEVGDGLLSFRRVFDPGHAWARTVDG